MSQMIMEDKINTIKGKWIKHPEFREYDICSICHVGCKRRSYGTNPDGTEYVEEENYSFCPHCGFPMEFSINV